MEHKYVVRTFSSQDEYQRIPVESTEGDYLMTPDDMDKAIDALDYALDHLARESAGEGVRGTASRQWPSAAAAGAELVSRSRRDAASAPAGRASPPHTACGLGGPRGVLCPIGRVPESTNGRDPASRTAALRDAG